MIETVEKLIGNNSYSITQLPARRALRLQAKLLKMIGPAASVIFSAAAKNVDTADSVIPQAVSLLVGQIDDKTFDTFVLELLQGVRKNGVEITDKTLDLEFAGNLNELYLVLQSVLEVNYGDFFQSGGILSALLSGEPPQSTQKPTLV